MECAEGMDSWTLNTDSYLGWSGKEGHTVTIMTVGRMEGMDTQCVLRLTVGSR